MNDILKGDVDILVVDDQPFNVMAFKNLLSSISKIHIDEAYDGMQSINMVNLY